MFGILYGSHFLTHTVVVQWQCVGLPTSWVRLPVRDLPGHLGLFLLGR